MLNPAIYETLLLLIYLFRPVFQMLSFSGSKQPQTDCSVEQKWKKQAALLKKQAQTRSDSRYGKTGNKHLQLVLQHCCTTSWKTMFRVLQPMFQPVSQQIKLQQKVESSLTFCNKIWHVNDIWNKSYMNCGNEIKMKKRSSQWTQFMQLRKEAWKKNPLKSWLFFRLLYAIA